MRGARQKSRRRSPNSPERAEEQKSSSHQKLDAAVGLDSELNLRDGFDAVVKDAGEVLDAATSQRRALGPRLARLRERLVDRAANPRPEDATAALAAIQPLLETPLALLRAGRGFYAACASLELAHQLLAVVATNQKLALAESDQTWDQQREALEMRLNRARSAARRSPSLKADAAPVCLLELRLTALTLGLKAMADPEVHVRY